jgi:hypothetical protein
LSRPLVVAALLFTLLFMLAIIAVRAQPYDASDLRDLIMPKSCPMPCFMGIRPGVTTVDEAVAILEESEWVDAVDTTNLSHIMWTWSSLQPDVIAAESKGVIEAFGDKGIREIRIQTTLPIGFMYLGLGEPRATDSFPLAFSSDVGVIGLYLDRSIEVSATLSCPVTRKKFWDAPMMLHYLSDAWQLTGFSYINYAC